MLGSGGREHAFAQKLAQSPKVEKLWIAPGNAGTAACGENVNMGVLEFEKIYAFARENQIDVLIPASEDPLVLGITDFIQAKNKENNTAIKVAGPSKWAAQLEGSKDFSKNFMKKNGIPTAAYLTVNQENLEAGIQFLHSLKAPYVLKADGLAAGKGVIITNDLQDAENQLREMILQKKFGEASSNVVIEEFLHGIEISVFAISDGKSWKFFGSAKDYKRIGEGDTGLNTGGMGAISPVPFADEKFMQKVEEKIVTPTFNGLQKEGHSFNGFLFIGLMNCDGEPYVVEYNVRMGDPETEAILPRLQTDMGDLFEAMVHSDLETLNLVFDNRTAVAIFLVSGGYPENFEKGIRMEIPEFSDKNVHVFHAGTKNEGGQILTNGGRVIALTNLGEDLESALQNSLQMAEKIKFDGRYFRRDIGRDLIQFQKKYAKPNG